MRDGIAFGMTVNEPKGQAAESAVRRCRTFKARDAADRCKVVATFSGQCFAVAYDPEPGTPGHGWGVGADQLAANQRAVAMCEEIAGPARKGYCQVESAACDTMGPQGAAADPSQQEPSGPEQKPAPEAASGTPAAPRNPALEAPRGPASKPPTRRQDQEGSSWLAPRSPAFLVGVMVTVGAAYALGQLARGKLKGGLGERNIVVGGALAVASGVLVKVLDLAGLEGGIVTALVAGLALAAAFFA